MEAVHAHSGRDAFEQVLECDGAVVIYETQDADALVEQFRLRARQTGQAVYRWNGSEGLVSLREGAVSVPGCLRIVDTLRYVQQSMHFGIYLIDIGEARLTDVELRLLRQIARTRTTHVRRVVLMNGRADLAPSLTEAATLREVESVQYRLRDGHWVR